MNTRIVNFVLAVAVAVSAMTAMAQSSDAVLRDKITNAVMKVYDDQLAKEPISITTMATIRRLSPMSTRHC